MLLLLLRGNFAGGEEEKEFPLHLLCSVGTVGGGGSGVTAVGGEWPVPSFSPHEVSGFNNSPSPAPPLHPLAGKMGERPGEKRAESPTDPEAAFREAVCRPLTST